MTSLLRRTLVQATASSRRYSPLPLRPPQNPPEIDSNNPEIRAQIVDTKTASDLPRPGIIPFQSKVVNSANLIGTVRSPIQFVISDDGKCWAGTLIFQESFCDQASLWVPLIFEGDLAHTAACHVKEKDNIYVAGHLTADPLPIDLTHGRTNVQVMVHALHFVRGYHETWKRFKN